MSNFVDAEHIRKHAAKGRVEVIGRDLAMAAYDHLLSAFPLLESSTIVDWEAVDSKVLKWNTATDRDTAEWARTTLAGRCSLGLLLFSPIQPCLLGEFEFMVRSFDEFVWTAPGCRILFGVDRGTDGRIEFTTGIIEFNGKGELFASV